MYSAPAAPAASAAYVVQVAPVVAVLSACALARARGPIWTMMITTWLGIRRCRDPRSAGAPTRVHGVLYLRVFTCGLGVGVGVYMRARVHISV